MKKPFSLKKRKPQNIYYFKLRDDRTYHSTGQTARVKAEEYVIRILEGDVKKYKEATLNQFAKDFFYWERCTWINKQLKKGKKFSPFMAKMRRGHLNNYILPEFGKRRLDSIKSSEIDDWLLGLKPSNRTKNHILGTFRIVLEEAVRQDIITKNFVRSIQPFAANSRERDVFTLDEMSRLFPLEQNRFLEIWGSRMWGTFFFVLATTGVRLGEAKALHWQDWMDTFNVLHIHESVKNDETIGSTKNGKPRAVTLLQRAVELLTEWKKQAIFAQPTDLMFCYKKDRPLNRKLCSVHFKKGLKNAGIETGNRNLVIHSFRHTANTIYRKVLDDKTLRAITGHMDLKMTELYDHPDLQDNIDLIVPYRNLLERAWDGNDKEKVAR